MQITLRLGRVTQWLNICRERARPRVPTLAGRVEGVNTGRKRKGRGPDRTTQHLVEEALRDGSTRGTGLAPFPSQVRGVSSCHMHPVPRCAPLIGRP